MHEYFNSMALDRFVIILELTLKGLRLGEACLLGCSLLPSGIHGLREQLGCSETDNVILGLYWDNGK